MTEDREYELIELAEQYPSYEMMMEFSFFNGWKFTKEELKYLKNFYHEKMFKLIG